MADVEVTEELNQLLDTLEGRLQAVDSVASSDAIDRERSAVGRTTDVVSLRNAPEIQAFRQALTDGLIRADTVNRVLGLINELVLRMGQGGG